MSRTRPSTHGTSPSLPLSAPARAVLAPLLLAACAQTPPPPPDPVMARAPAQPGPVIGVAVIEPRSDVADLTEAMRHVLHPTGNIGTAVVMPAVIGQDFGPASASDSGAGAALAPRAPDSPAEIEDTASQPDARADQAGSVEPPDEPRDTPALSVDTPTDATGSGTVEPPGAPGAPIGDAAADDGDHSGPEVLTPGQATQDAIVEAWERYCASDDLSAEQWGIIDRTSMPASLEAEWADRCRPEK